MLRFSLFGIPVVVDWWFWLTVALIGGGLRAQNPEDWQGVIVFALVAFISIIVHELGHGLAGRRFGVSPGIKLHAFGGLTYLPGAHFSRRESIIVSAAGPTAGFLLAFVFLLAQSLSAGSPYLLRLAIFYGVYINVVWTLLNLLPIQPLDGGQILREALGPRRLHITTGAGFIVAGLLSVWAFLTGLYIMAVLLAVLAFYNYQQHPVEGGVMKG